MALPLTAVAQASVPTFSKAFSPSTIGPGSASTLTFTIDNSAGSNVTDLAFSDMLPAGMTIATPANAATSCIDGILSAPDGGSTISLSGGRVATGNSCTVTVNVTATATGTNVSGNLTSSGGSSGSATATLTVSGARPGFSKSFSPSLIPVGGTSTLTFTIDNTANAAAVAELQFNDILPAGMVIAALSNAASDCGPAPGSATVTATSGTGVISLFVNGFPAVAAGATCTVTVDVTTNTAGLFVNISGELLSGSGVEVSSGVATAVLNVPVQFLNKSFTDDPVAPGESVTLEFSIHNLNRSDSLTNIAFTDDLDAVVSGMVATGLPISACGGTLSATSTISLAGGNIPPEGSCTFSVTLSVPGTASAGSFTNTTTLVTATRGGIGVTGNTATDVLFVSPIPTLTKEFTDDPVGAGSSVILEFTITNTSAGSTATDVAFVDELTTFLPFPVSLTLPPTPDPPCNGASSLDLVSLGDERQGLSLTGGTLSGGASCTFSVVIEIPLGLASGFYTNTTDVITRP